jgi:hypothetical protein
VAKRPKRPENHPAVARLLEQAAANGAQETRNMHIVPNFYLKHWAEDGKVRVTDLATRRSRVRSTKKAAVERDFYRLADPALDPAEVPPQLAETLYGRVEDMAAPLLRRILDVRPTGVDVKSILDEEDRGWLLWFLAFQTTRGHSFRRQIQSMNQKWLLLQIEHLADEGALRSDMEDELGRPPTDEEVVLRQEVLDQFRSGDLVPMSGNPELTGLSQQNAEHLLDPLFNRHWVLIETPAVLITCDEPVVRIAGPPARRSLRSGVGAAAVVVFPLAPDAALCMFDYDRFPVPPTERLDHVEVSELNREIAAFADRVVFERPAKKVGERTQVPPPAPAVVWDPEVELVGEKPGRAIHSWVATRWASTSTPPPWPVESWWQ